MDLADPGVGEVRIRMEACGICRSDLHAIDGGEDVRFPAVLGHEGAGIVDAIGPAVDGLAEGQRVILSWTPACGTCPPCLCGEPHLCREVAMSSPVGGPLSRGGEPLDRFMRLGLFCERVVVPGTMAIPIEGSVPAAQTCLIGCGVMTGFGAATKTAAVHEGECVAILGCGGVGLAAVQGARLAGATRIFAIDPDASRRDVARRLGASEVLDVAGAVERIREGTGGGVDAAIECVGKSEAIRDAFLMTRPGGRAVVVGLPDLSASLEIPAILLLGERKLTGSLYGSADPARDFQKLVTLCEEGRLDLETLVGRIRPFEEVNEAIGDARKGRFTRVVLTFRTRSF